MTYRAKAFPYPVLASFNSDFGSAVAFAFEIVRYELIGEASQDLSIDYQTRLSKTWIDEYVLDGAARLVVDVECRATMHREYIPLTEFAGTLNFREGQLYGVVTFTPLIVAVSGNPRYAPEGICSEFGGGSFAIRKGDILGIGDADSIDLEFTRTLERNLITIQYTDQLESDDVYRFVLSGPRIIIEAGSNLREPIGHLRADSELRKFLFMSVYKDCLAAALNYLVKEGGGEETDLPWGRTLLRKLEDVGRRLYYDSPEEQEISAQILVAERGIKRVGVERG